MIYPRYNFVESEIYPFYAEDRPEIHLKYTWDIHSLVCVWFSFRKFLHILQAGTCQRILDGAKCGKNCCVFQGYLKTVSVFKDIFWLFTRKKISHIGNCKQINIPCSGKKFTWGEQVQWGGDLWCGLTSQYCALSPFATSIGNPVQSDVSCPPSIINSGIGFYFKNEDSGNEAPAYCASFLDSPYKCRVV